MPRPLIEKLSPLLILYLTKSAGFSILRPEARFGYGAVDDWSPLPPVRMRAFALSQYMYGCSQQFQYAPCHLSKNLALTHFCT